MHVAQHAPSGGNLQPWIVHVVSGPALRALVAAIAAKLSTGSTGDAAAPAVYPPGLWEPYRSRRSASGRDRYAALGVGDKDDGARLDLLRRNLRFFGAPVGLLFMTDSRMQFWQWADIGMLMQNVMLLARDRGLDTCPQAVWANWPTTLRAFTGAPDNLTVVAGMALGYADTDDPLCRLPAHRAPLADFAVFHDEFHDVQLRAGSP